MAPGEPITFYGLPNSIQIQYRYQRRMDLESSGKYFWKEY